jgi:glucokinase
VVDSDGEIRDKCKIPSVRTLQETVAHIAERLEQALAQGPVDRVGVVIPGIYNPRRGTAWAPNLWGWDPVPVRKALEAKLPVPVVISSDRSGYVLGEEWLGVAKGLEDVVFVAVGTGIGAGILCGGRLLEGAHGIAGAVGWMALPGTWNPKYAQTGCWEWEAADPALARRAGLDSAESVVEKARAGDSRALAAIRETADFLAMGVANLISVFDPDMVVLGGGLMQAGDLLFEEIRAGVPRWAQPIAVQHVQIALTHLGEDAGLLGAARLALLSSDRYSNRKSEGVL